MEKPANIVISCAACADQQFLALSLKTTLKSIIREKPITDRRVLIYLHTRSNELFFFLHCIFCQLKSDYKETYYYRS